MSGLARSAMSARLAKLPNLPPIPPPTSTDEQEEADELDDIGDLPPRIPPSLRRPPPQQRDLSAYAPISAAAYFAQALSVAVPDVSLDFRIYYTPPSNTDFKAQTVVVCHHGAGSSALTFACFAKELTRVSNAELGVMAIDARSHGRTKPIQKESLPDAAAEEHASDAPLDLSIERLTDDFVSLLQVIWPDPSVAPSILLLGHSMGGTVIVRACPLLQDKKYRITGVTVLDVVEGFSLEAMPLMRGLLASRPSGFESPEEAVQWHLNNKTIRNPQSARVSVPATFIESPTATAEHKYMWRAPLQLTEPYWTGWFTGLSASFLAVRTARLLILAGTDRLDKTLMIGQMQGKFQLEVIGDVGHMLHEDDPQHIAEIVVDFWKRNERLPLGFKIKKVGEA